MTDINTSYVHALAEVKQIVCRSRTSFHAGMMFLPRDRRNAMYALYAFCRVVDDIADDGATPEIRGHGLQQWRERLSNLFRRKTATESITTALLPAIEAYRLVEKDFQDIIDGMAMDAGAPICAPDLHTFDLYCDRVASAVGRASVRIFGDASDDAMQVAYHLGRALQKTNILRDLAEDAARERLYLPDELLTKHNVMSRKPAEVLADPNLRAACRDLASEAAMHFTKADQFMSLCDRAAMRPARIMRAYYGAILDRLQREDWRDVSKRASLSKIMKIVLILRVLFTR